MMNNIVDFTNKSKIQVKTTPSLASFSGSIKDQKIPREKDLELLFAHEAINRNTISK